MAAAFILAGSFPRSERSDGSIRGSFIPRIWRCIWPRRSSCTCCCCGLMRAGRYTPGWRGFGRAFTDSNSEERPQPPTSEITAMFASSRLLWSLHPVQVETVSWISGMKDLLAGWLAIEALWRYAAGVQDSNGKSCRPGVRATLAMTAALLAKPSAIVTPALALTIDWLILNRPFRQAIRTSGPWFLIAIPVRDRCNACRMWRRSRTCRFCCGRLSLAIRLRFTSASFSFRCTWRSTMDVGPGSVIDHPDFKFTWIVSAAAIVIVVLLRRRARQFGGGGIAFSCWRSFRCQGC